LPTTPGGDDATPTPTPVVFAPATVSLLISKTGSKASAEVGDSVTYTLTVKRTDTNAGVLPSFAVVDTLPAGFTYIPGTLTVDAMSVTDASVLSLNPQGNNPVMSMTINKALTNSNAVTISYRVRIAVGAMEGTGINRATAKTSLAANCAVSPASCSNEGRYTVKVNAGVFTTQACVIGKVYVDCNQNGIQDNEEIGIPGVKLYLLDGTSVITDVEGKYNVCDLKPQTHVIAVDRKTMPRGSVFGTTSNRNALDGSSLFMDLKKGELHRADFTEASCANPIIEQVKARRAQGEVRAAETESGRSAAGEANKGLKYQAKPIGNPVETTDGANQPAIRVRQ
jgi:fimbrial isopeptide formation D2 family protein